MNSIRFIAGKVNIRLWIVPLLIAYVTVVAIIVWSMPRCLPSGLELHLLGKTLDAATLSAKLVSIGLMPLIILPAIFVGELAVVGWADSSLRQFLVKPSRSVMTDLTIYLLRLTHLFEIIALVFSLGVAAISADWIRRQVADATGLSLSVAGLPLVAQVPLLFLVYTFFDYWSHRTDHSSRFWPLHRYHHAAKDFCILNSCRAHPAAFTGLIIAGATVLVGGSATAFVITGLFVGALRFFIHSRVNFDFGWVGRTLIQSPRHHRLHHALEITEGVNFSLCPLWDRLFGTWREVPQADWVIGVSTDYQHGGLITADIWRDYREFWAGLLAPLAKLIPNRAGVPARG